MTSIVIDLLNPPIWWENFSVTNWEGALTFTRVIEIFKDHGIQATVGSLHNGLFTISFNSESDYLMAMLKWG